jgi:hypothetical protein
MAARRTKAEAAHEAAITERYTTTTMPQVAIADEIRCGR